jgi:hypothetical protein
MASIDLGADALVAGDGDLRQSNGDRVDPRGELLRGRWRAASFGATWSFPGDWLCPATEAVLEAVLERRDPAAAVAELGRQRASCFVSLAEALDDLAALARTIGWGQAPADLVRALALGWADEMSSAQIAGACTDPLTGLATPAYLRTRLGEVYAEAARTGADAGERYALVVADARTGADVSAFDRAAALISLGELLITVFSGGETVAASGPGMAVVLAARDGDLLLRHRTLRRLMELKAPDQAMRTWIERLPGSLSSARELIADLSR